VSESLLDEHYRVERWKGVNASNARAMSCYLSLKVPDNAHLGWKRFASLRRDAGGNIILADWFGGGLNVKHVARHPMVAACLKPSGHVAPDALCKCGIWTFDQCEPVFNFWGCGHVRLVVGRVAQWGRVFEAERALRSEFAYPVTIYTDYQREADLAVEFCGDVRPLSPLLNEHGRGWCVRCTRVKRLSRLHRDPEECKDDFLGEPLICETCVRAWRVAL